MSTAQAVLNTHLKMNQVHGHYDGEDHTGNGQDNVV